MKFVFRTGPSREVERDADRYDECRIDVNREPLVLDQSFPHPSMKVAQTARKQKNRGWFVPVLELSAFSVVIKAVRKILHFFCIEK